MAIFAFGVNHATAPVALRERVAFAPEGVPPALRELASRDGINEAAIVSTCNRTDLYCELQDASMDAAVDWFRSYHRLESAEILPFLYRHRADSAVRHLLRVASGLDSLVLGEPQILGQVKAAHRLARASGTAGRVLDRVFQHSFAVAKQVRTETSIGSSAVSVAYAAVSLARRIFGKLDAHTALLIGAGETIELTARHLHAHGLGRMIIANRTAGRAHRLADQLGGYAIALADLPAHLAEADIIVSSTASPAPLLTRTQAEAAVRARRRRPVFIADLAVPRDVEAAVGELEDVYLYTIDDLGAVIEENRRSRAEAAREAESLIEAQVERIMGWLGTQSVVGVIRRYRSDAEETRDAVLAKAQRILAAGGDPEAALRFLAHTLTNKLLHAPTVELRRAGAEGRRDLVDAARSLLDIDPAPRPRRPPHP